jgi:hypothetical protein
MPPHFALKPISRPKSERKTATIFVTVSGDSTAELRARIDDLRAQGFTQVGLPITTEGAAGLSGPAIHVCLMSKPSA